MIGVKHWHIENRCVMRVEDQEVLYSLLVIWSEAVLSVDTCSGLKRIELRLSVSDICSRVILPELKSYDVRKLISSFTCVPS
jgi:hypothetical protein